MMGVEETYEQYEERVLNKRAVQMQKLIGDRLDINPTLHFHSLIQGNNRKQVNIQPKSFTTTKIYINCLNK